MKKYFSLKYYAFLMALVLCLALTACGGKTVEVTLYADFSNGSETAEADGLIQTESAQVAEETPAALAEALSDWTGLDFEVGDVAVDGKKITVDWAASSTLVAGLDDREQKEGFHFYDADSLRWFMMDSLYRTLTENLDAEEVYYTMDGGKELTLDGMNPVSIFPSDIAYQGSPFYFAHADVQGDLGSDADFSRTEGTWRLDGDPDSASIYMDGAGGFIAYYASGYVEAAGYLEYVDEYGDGNGRYDMYDGELGFINGFYFDSDTQIHMGNDGETIYIRMDDGQTASGGSTGGTGGTSGTGGQSGGQETGDDTERPPHGVLVYGPGFTGLTPLESDNDYHGGYYYADRTEDGLTVIVNCGFINDFGEQDADMDAYIFRKLEMVCGESPAGLDSHESTFGSYPAYRLNWLTGGNEDFRNWDALMVCTDNYTYLYAFHTAADYAAEKEDLWLHVVSSLELVFPDE